MTLEDVTRLCPVPEGWRAWDEVYPHMWSTGSASPRAWVSVEIWTCGLRVRALVDREDHYIVTSEEDLPAAYSRALAAVGLTPPTPNLRARVEGVLTKLREWAEDEPVFSEAADLLEAAIKGDSP